MFTAKQPLHLTPTGLVVIPIGVASIMTGALVLMIAASDTVTIASPAALLIAGILIYAAVLFFLGRSGIASIRGLEARASTDPLTHLPNRHALHDDILRHSLGSEEVALAMIDLDSFKQVNDHYGHAVGDQLIAQCADLIREVCGTEARAYRLGGDEFAAVMVGKVSGTILEGICRTLLEKLGTPVTLEHRHIAVGASIGLTRSTPDHMSKRGGKMRCTWFNESFDRRRERVREIEDEIRTAIAGGEFNVAYQPLVSAETKRIVAVEALLRWDRGTRDPLGPNIFVPVAEESGLINPLGLWVLRQAVCDARRWGDITLSVNISAAQLRNAEFPIKLGEVLEETGFPPHRLELEVTETCLVLDPVVAERTLDVIRSFGVRIALDDFGTGYASIGRTGAPCRVRPDSGLALLPRAPGGRDRPPDRSARPQRRPGRRAPDQGRPGGMSALSDIALDLEAEAAGPVPAAPAGRLQRWRRWFESLSIGGKITLFFSGNLTFALLAGLFVVGGYVELGQRAERIRTTHEAALGAERLLVQLTEGQRHAEMLMASGDPARARAAREALRRAETSAAALTERAAASGAEAQGRLAAIRGGIADLSGEVGAFDADSADPAQRRRQAGDIAATGSAALDAARALTDSFGKDAATMADNGAALISRLLVMWIVLATALTLITLFAQRYFNRTVGATLTAMARQMTGRNRRDGARHRSLPPRRGAA